MIVNKEGKKWVLISESGKTIGVFDTKAAAKKRLEELEYLNNKKGN